MTAPTDTMAVVELDWVPEGPYTVGGDEAYREAFEKELQAFAKEHKVSVEIVTMNGPGGGGTIPVVVMSGEPARVAFAVCAYNGVDAETLDTARYCYFGEE